MGDKSVIITGINGFVGTNLSSSLVGKKIVGVSRKPKKNEISYNELNSTSMNNSKAIIHLAGKAHDFDKIIDHDYYSVNTELTKQIFDSFLRSDCEIFIYLSSVKAAAEDINVVLTEDITPKPVTSYGKSKLAAENYIFSKKIKKNQRVYVLRPCMVHGPKNKGNLNLLYNIFSRGYPWPLGKFDNLRSFCSIENLIFVINELLVQRNINSGIYNIADDKPISTNQLITLISKSIKTRPIILNVPKFIIKFIALIGDKFYLPLNSKRLKKLTETYVVSNKKIIKAINKTFPVTSENGLLRTFKSFKNNITIK